MDFPLAELIQWMVVRLAAGMPGAGSGDKIAELVCSWIGVSSTSTAVSGWPVLHEGSGVDGCVGAVVGGMVVDLLCAEGDAVGGWSAWVLPCGGLLD